MTAWGRDFAEDRLVSAKPKLFRWEFPAGGLTLAPGVDPLAGRRCVSLG